MSKLTKLNFMAICTILGIVSKRMINPFANIITEMLHIPGGIGTAFSIMFLVIGKELVQERKCATLMATVQGLLSLALGFVGSMGILMPIAFIATGIAIDIVYYVCEKINCEQVERMAFANAMAALSASLVANFLVFQLPFTVVWLYFGVSLLCGTSFGILGSSLATRLKKVLQIEYRSVMS